MASIDAMTMADAPICPKWVRSPIWRRRVEKALHKFSSTQFNIEDASYTRTQGSPRHKIEAMARRIADEDLAKDGREDRPHVTVKYGLHTGNVEEVRRVVQGFGTVKIKLGKTSLFPASKDHPFEVVKIDVSGDSLHRLNRLITNSVECTDTHPTYKPHVTLAYVKPGAGKKYVGMTDVDGMEISCHRLVFSDQDKNKTAIYLDGITKALPAPVGAPRIAKPKNGLPPGFSGIAPPDAAGRRYQYVNGRRVNRTDNDNLPDNDAGKQTPPPEPPSMPSQASQQPQAQTQPFQAPKMPQQQAQQQPAAPVVNDWKEKGVYGQAFKSWFGDWEKEPEKASQVRNPKTGKPLGVVVSADSPTKVAFKKDDGSEDVVEYHDAITAKFAADESKRGDTNTPRVMNHGTSRGYFDEFDLGKAKPEENILGAGVYMTADDDVAKTYTQGKGVANPDDVKPYVHKLYANIRKPFDVDRMYSADEFEKITGQKIGVFRKIDLAVNDKPTDRVSGWDIFKAVAKQYKPVRNFMYNNFTGRGDFRGKEYAKAHFEKLGYDGFTHVGGTKAGASNLANQTDQKLHRVWIAFNENQVKSVDNEGTFSTGTKKLKKHLPNMVHKAIKRSPIWKALKRKHFDASKHPRGNPKNRGQFARSSVTQSNSFKQWFGESKIVDGRGEPLVVYHGTTSDFNEFDPNKGKTTIDRLGSWFAKSPKLAEERLLKLDGQMGFSSDYLPRRSNTIAAYVSIKNPLTFKKRKDLDDYLAENVVLPKEMLEELHRHFKKDYEAKSEFVNGTTTAVEKYYESKKARIRINSDALYGEEGLMDEKFIAKVDALARKSMEPHDGIVIEDDHGYGTAYVVFNPAAIKSATANRTFDPSDKRIGKSVSGPRRDSRGREYLWVNGKRVAKPKTVGEPIDGRGLEKIASLAEKAIFESLNQVADLVNAVKVIGGGVVSGVNKGQELYGKFTDYIDSQVKKLPGPVEKVVRGAYKLYCAPYAMAQKATGELAKEHGFSPATVHRISATVAVVDFVAGKAQSLFGVGSSSVPLGSLAYLVFATAVHPVATYRAARKGIERARTKLGVAKGLLPEATMVALGERMEKYGEDYFAAFLVAMDTERDAKKAMRLADEVVRGREQEEKHLDLTAHILAGIVGGMVTKSMRAFVIKATKRREGEQWVTNGRHYRRAGGKTVRIAPPGAKEETPAKPSSKDAKYAAAKDAVDRLKGGDPNAVDEVMESLGKLTVPQLRALAKEQGFAKVSGRAKKEILDGLKAGLVPGNSAVGGGTSVGSRGSSSAAVSEAFVDRFFNYVYKDSLNSDRFKNETPENQAALIAKGKQESRAQLEKMAKRIADKDVSLADNHALHPSNKMYRELFTEVTGITLPSGSEATRKAVKEFLGEKYQEHAKSRADKEANEAKEKADKKRVEKETKDSEYSGFAADLPPRQRAKIHATLETQVSHNGKVTTRKEMVERLVKAGFAVDGEKLTNGSNYYDKQAMTKTGLDYASHLVKQGFGPKEGERNSAGLVFHNHRWHREDDIDPVRVDLRQLSSGTMATLTGRDKYDDIEAARKMLDAWLSVRPGVKWGSWQDAWGEFVAKYPEYSKDRPEEPKLSRAESPFPLEREERKSEPASTDSAKEPWEMTASELENYKESHPDFAAKYDRKYSVNFVLAHMEFIKDAIKAGKVVPLRVRKQTGDVEFWEKTKEELLNKAAIPGGGIRMFGGSSPQNYRRVILSTQEREELEQSHRTAIVNALAAGKPVPAEVLADYPDLKPKADVPKSSRQTPSKGTPERDKQDAEWNDTYAKVEAAAEAASKVKEERDNTKRSTKKYDQLDAKYRKLQDEYESMHRDMQPLRKLNRLALLEDTIEHGDEANAIAAKAMMDREAGNNKRHDDAYTKIMSLAEASLKSNYGLTDSDAIKSIAMDATSMVLGYPGIESTLDVRLKGAVTTYNRKTANRVNREAIDALNDLSKEQKASFHRRVENAEFAPDTQSQIVAEAKAENESNRELNKLAAEHEKRAEESRQEREAFDPDIDSIPVKSIRTKGLIKDLNVDGRWSFIGTAKATGYATNGKYMFKLPEKEMAVIRSTPDNGNRTLPQQTLDTLLNSNHEVEPATIKGVRHLEDVDLNSPTYLIESPNGTQALMNATYVRLILDRYPNATMHLPPPVEKSKSTTRPAVFKDQGTVIGVVMPIEDGRKYKVKG